MRKTYFYFHLPFSKDPKPLIDAGNPLTPKQSGELLDKWHKKLPSVKDYMRESRKKADKP